MTEQLALVCGAGGFIGSHLVKRLRAGGWWVRGVDLKYPEFSDTTALRIDEAIKALIVAVEADATALVRKHRPALDRLAERLLEAETLERAEIEALLQETSRGGAQALRAAAVS